MDEHATSNCTVEAIVVSDTVPTMVEVNHGDTGNTESVWTRSQVCEIAISKELDKMDIQNTESANKSFHELQALKEKSISRTSKKGLKRSRDLSIKTRKDEHKRWRSAIDEYAQYSEWISKVSEKVEDMPDIDGTGSGSTTEEAEDVEAEYFIAVDSMRDIIAQIEEARAAQAKEIVESDAKLEEILKYYEEHMKRSDLFNDKNKQENYQMFVCFACGRVFEDEIVMRDHVNEIHLSNRNFTFKCRHCYRRFKMKHHLQRHELTHDLSLVHTCDMCSSSFRNFESLISHKSKAHRINENGELITCLMYNCTKCGNKFGTFIELNRHKYSCLKGPRTKVQGSSGGAVSAPSSASSIFSLISRPKVDKTCKICNSKFASRQSLIRHMGRIHPGEKIDEIKRYEVAPSPDLPFACNICSKRFATSTLMLVHRKRHEGRNFACNLCHKTYPLASELRKHIKRVHESSRKETSAVSVTKSVRTDEEASEGVSSLHGELASTTENRTHNYDDLTDFNIM